MPTMKLIFSGIFVSAALMAQTVAVAASDMANISMADKPVRIIRGTAVYKANIGVLVQKYDIVETDAAGAQLEVSPELIMALGPETRLYLSSIDSSSRTDLVLLQGWIKVMSKGKSAVTIITSPVIRVTVNGGSSIVYSTADKGEMFAEEATQIVNGMDDHGKPGADVKISHDQFAIGSQGQDLKMQPRPTKEFLAEMPVSFRDRIIPAVDRMKGARLSASKEREVDFSDVDAWLSSNLAVKKSFVSRFLPRIKDVNFRKQLDEKLGQSAEWKMILHPPPPPPKEQAKQKS